jgi:putative hemolysin
VSDALQILLLLALIAGNAFFVIGEYAVVTARPVGARAAGGGRQRRRARALSSWTTRSGSSRPCRSASRRSACSSARSASRSISDLLGDAVPGWVAFALGFAVVTYLSVVLGELVPRR